MPAKAGIQAGSRDTMSAWTPKRPIADIDNDHLSLGPPLMPVPWPLVIGGIEVTIAIGNNYGGPEQRGAPIQIALNGAMNVAAEAREERR